MSPDQSKPLTVTTLGMSRRTRHVLRMYLKRLGRGFYKVVDEADGQLILIDLDDPQGEELWAGHRTAFPGRPAIVLCTEERSVEEARFIRKPIQLRDILRTLEEVRREMLGLDRADALHSGVNHSARVPREPLRRYTRALEKVDPSVVELCGSAAEVRLEAPEAARTVFYDPRVFLQGPVQDAHRQSLDQGRPVRVVAFGRRITILPKRRRAVLQMKERELRPISRLELDENFQVAVLHERERRVLEELEAQGAVTRRLDSFIWELALCTARGRVPTGTDLTAPMFLRHWPNLTRLQLTPHALRIAALWSAQPHSLLDTAKNLRIPQRFVFSFYSALDALGLCGPARRKSDFFFAEPMPMEHRGDRKSFARTVAKLTGELVGGRGDNGLQRNKIIVAGPPGVGKTTALGCLSDRRLQTVQLAGGPSGEDRLEMDLGVVEVDAQTQIQLYGMTRKGRFDQVQRLFRTKALGLVVLLDSTRSDPLGELREIVESFGPLIEETRLAVGITRTDQALRVKVEDYYRRIPRGTIRPPIFEVDCRDKDDLSLLIQALLYSTDPGLEEETR
jgi:signal recognition particle receptor subunit beta